MAEECIVVSVEGSSVTASPLSPEACASCASSCGHRGTTFSVRNPRNLDVRPGMRVRVEASKKAQAVEGVLSLLVPFASAVLLWWLSAPIAALLGRTATEAWKAVFLLSGLTVSSAVVLIVTRKKPVPGLPEITEIL